MNLEYVLWIIPCISQLVTSRSVYPCPGKHLLSTPAASSVKCPMQECHCEKGINKPGPIINCRDKILHHIPKIVPSSDTFYELTFSTSQDINGQNCKTCNNITDIPPKAFNGLKVLKINLNKNRIKNCSKEAFDGLESTLEELCLSGNKETFPPYLALANLTGLKSLDLQNYNQGFFDENNYLSNFPELKILRLINMKIGYIAGKSFKGRLQNLTSLEIRDNEEMMIIPVRSINNLVRLKHLLLIKNGIRIVPYGSFKQLNNIMEIDLSQNVIVSLDHWSFLGVWESLKILKLNMNKLDENSVQTFHEANWTNLKHLDLSVNHFSIIPPNMFNQMNNLSFLNLAANDLEKISKGDFDGLYNLKELKLESNRLVYIDGGALSDLGELLILNLEGQNENVLDSKILDLKLRRDIFKGTEEKLEELILTSSKLDPEKIWGVIQDLTNLNILKLGNTGINFIQDFVFSKFSKLKLLQLSGNNISYISQKSFHGLQQTLKYLDLSSNNMKTIDHCVFHDFNNLDTLDVQDNPLISDCGLEWLQKWLQKRRNFFPMESVFKREPLKYWQEDKFHNVNDSLNCDNYTEPTCLSFETTTTTIAIVTDFNIDTTVNISTGNDTSTSVTVFPSYKASHNYLWTIIICSFFTFIIAVALLFLSILLC